MHVQQPLRVVLSPRCAVDQETDPDHHEDYRPEIAETHMRDELIGQEQGSECDKYKSADKASTVLVATWRMTEGIIRVILCTRCSQGIAGLLIFHGWRILKLIKIDWLFLRDDP